MIGFRHLCILVGGEFAFEFRVLAFKIDGGEGLPNQQANIAADKVAIPVILPRPCLHYQQARGVQRQLALRLATIPIYPVAELFRRLAERQLALLARRCFWCSRRGRS